MALFLSLPTQRLLHHNRCASSAQLLLSAFDLGPQSHLVENASRFGVTNSNEAHTAFG